MFVELCYNNNNNNNNNDNNIYQIVLLREKSYSEKIRKFDATSYTGKELCQNVKIMSVLIESNSSAVLCLPA